MLVKMLDKYDLKKEFSECGRDYFSLDGYQGLIDLFDNDVNNVDLDVIAICCDFTEAEAEDIKNDYCNIDRIAEAEDINDLMEALNYYTYACLLDNGSILYQNF